MITGVFENHGATGEATLFPSVDASMGAQSPLFDRAPRSGQMAACTQAGCKLLLESEACQLVQHWSLVRKILLVFDHVI